jgi:hypothetical protein
MQLSPNDSLTITRLTENASGHKKFTTTVFTSLSCYSEPIQDEFAIGAFEQNAVYPKKAYDFGAVYDVKVGDKAVDSEGKTWIVKGVRKFENNTDIENDMELLLVSESQ